MFFDVGDTQYGEGMQLLWFSLDSESALVGGPWGHPPGGEGRCLLSFGGCYFDRPLLFSRVGVWLLHKDFACSF